MHRSLSNKIDYIEIPSRHLAETKHFFSALWLVVRRLRPDYASFDDGRMAGGEFAIWSDK